MIGMFLDGILDHEVVNNQAEFGGSVDVLP